MKRTGLMTTALRGSRMLMRMIALAAVLSASPARSGPIELTVMTRNAYFGADLAPIFAAPDAQQVPFAVAGVFATAAASKPAERMTRIAQEIFAAKPHIVGLQEAVLWRSQTPSDFAPGSPPNAATLEFGGAFSAQIVGALAGLGMSYTPYALKQNADNELPGLNPASSSFLTDYRLTDFDVVLVRSDLPAAEFKVLGSGSQSFAAGLTIPIAGFPTSISRSYGFVDVAIGGIPVRVFNTHLEPVVGLINELQAAELIAAMNSAPYRQIVLGDFNSIAEDGPTAADEMILAAGFTDAWADKGNGPGFTWRDDELLNDLATEFTQRLDYVFHRGGFATLSAEVTGTAPFDASGDGPPLWASDHAALVTTLQVIPEPSTLALALVALVALGATRCTARLPAALSAHTAATSVQGTRAAVARR